MKRQVVNLKIEWAVIGAAGMVGRRAVPELMAADNCQLVAVMARSEDRVKPLAEKWGVSWFTSAQEMLNQVTCDAVYIASPQHVHREHVELAAGRGCHVLCEKPLAPALQEAEEMVKICQQAGVKMGTAFNYRFHGLHLKARELVAQGAVGTVVSARGQLGHDNPPTPGSFRQVARSSGGGAMVDMGGHVMDLIEFITQKRFQQIMAVTYNQVHQYEVEDVCAALLEFSGGGFAFVDTYYCVPHGALRNDLEINGNKGTLYTVDTLRNMATSGKLVLRAKDLVQEYPVEGPDMYRAQFRAFAKAVLEDTEPPCDGMAGLRSQRLLDACYRSARLGRKIPATTEP